MSTNKTQHYNLHSWVPQDDFLMAEMNENFTTLDAQLRQEAATLDGLIKAETTARTAQLALKADKTETSALQTALDQGLQARDSALDNQVKKLNTALDSKADKTTVTTLQNTVNNKADKTTVTTLENTVKNKADSSKVTALETSLKNLDTAALRVLSGQYKGHVAPKNTTTYRIALSVKPKVVLLFTDQSDKPYINSDYTYWGVATPEYSLGSGLVLDSSGFTVSNDSLFIYNEETITYRYLVLY